MIQNQKQYQWPHSNTCETMNHIYNPRAFYEKNITIRADGTNSNFPVLHKILLSLKRIKDIEFTECCEWNVSQELLESTRANVRTFSFSNLYINILKFLVNPIWLQSFWSDKWCFKIGNFSILFAPKPVFEFFTPRICLFILNFPSLKSVILTNMSKLCNCFIDFSVYSDIYCFLNRLFTQVFLNTKHKLRSKCLQMVWITWSHGISCNAGVLHHLRLFKFHRLFKIIEWKMGNLIKIWFILS